MTQEEVAHGSDINVRYLGGIERGQENPYVAVLARIANVLTVHPMVLWDDRIYGAKNRKNS